MTEKEAKKIGSRQGLISVGIGLVIAQLIMTGLISSDESLFKAFFWFIKIDYKLNIFVGAIIMLLTGYLFGKIAGKGILIKKRSFVLVGPLCGVSVLIITAFLSGWTGFIKEGIENIGTNDNSFEAYILAPFYWVTLYGIIPALLVGIWFGRQIKKKG